jgi:hypothetical protein
MVFNATFNNISVISWRSILLVEEIGGPGENHDILVTEILLKVALNTIKPTNQKYFNDIYLLTPGYTRRMEKCLLFVCRVLCCGNGGLWLFF